MKNKLLVGLVLSFMLLSVSAFAVLDDAVIGYSYDDENNNGSNPEDITGNGRDGTNNGLVTGVAGVLGQAYDSDGGTDTISRNDNLFTGNEGTFITWVNLDTVTSFDWFVQQGDSNSDRSVDLFLTTGPKISFSYSTVSSGAYNTQYTQTANFAPSGWTMLAVVRDGTNHTLAFNCVVEPWTLTSGSATTNNYRDPSTDGFRLYGRNSPNSLDGKVDQFLYYDRALSVAELCELHNIINPYASYIFSISAENTFTGATLNEFSANVSFTNASGFFSYNKTTSTGQINFSEINFGEIVNVTVYKDNWFVTDSRNNYNTSTELTAQLAEAQISLTASSIITNSTITPANFTIGNYTFASGETIGIDAGTYNVTFSKDGWYNKTQEITVVADASQSFVIDNVYNAIANITYRDSQLNQTVNDYNLIVTQSSYTQDYSINNQSSYEVPLLNNLQYNFEFINSSYFTTNEVVNINSTYSNYTFYVTEVGDVEIFIYDLNTTNLITSSVNLLVQNSSNEVNYTITSGNGFIEDLVVGSEYNLQFSAIGYETNNYVFTYTNQSSIDLFMNANYEDITFLTQNSASSPLQGTNVQVERFFNGSYEVISVGNTDIIGEFVTNLQTGLTHRITFTKSGFTTQSFITQLTQNTYTITMQPVSVFDYSQGLDGVSSVVTPQNNTLFPTTVNFTVVINDENENLEYYFARLYYNGSILISDNDTASAGGTLTFLYDVSSFNNSGLPLLLEYGYATSDSGVINLYKAYAVSSDENYAGSLLQLRDRMSEKLSLLEKLSIFGFVFVLLLLMFSTLVQGIINVIISSGLALIIGWIVGINLIILITIFVLSVIIVMAFGSRDL